MISMRFLLLWIPFHVNISSVSGWLAIDRFAVQRDHSIRNRGASLQSATPPAAPNSFHHTSLSQSESENESLRELFPSSSSPVRNGTFSSDDGMHQIYYEIHGRGPLTALFLHGGPGAGCFPNHARFFDLEKYQVVLMDQRGCGRSQPRSACLVHQTLRDVVEDCETLRRDELGCDSWDLVLGGSWGTTLAIAYAQEHPTAMRSVILRGVCLLRPQEVDWLFARPQTDNVAWQNFCQAVGISGRDPLKYPRQVLHSYYERLVLSQNDTVRQQAARGWSSWEFYNGVQHRLPKDLDLSGRNAAIEALQSRNNPQPKISPVLVHKDGSWQYQSVDGQPMTDSNLPTDDATIQSRFRRGLSNAIDNAREPWPFPDTFPDNSSLPIQPLLTCFYSTNNDYCMNYRKLLEGEFPKDIPCIAVQGGSDGICPPDTALDVLQAWPHIELRMPMDAGHSMYDPYITHELVQATDRMAMTLLALGKEEAD